MVKRDGTASKSRGSDGSSSLRNRIEGFGNGPAPPPLAESFEDRLHDALSRDETIGNWYSNARAGMDAMVSAFDDTVNAIADTIEDTVAAVVGDDDWEPERNPAHQRRGDRDSGRDRERDRDNSTTMRSRSDSKDDGERSGTKWNEVVSAICVEGDLDTFTLLIRTQCVNRAEEQEVGALLSEQLLNAEKNSEKMRALYVMQAVVEGDLPVVTNTIREKCATKLEKLQASSFYKTLATQILGPGRPSGNSSSASGEKEKEQTKSTKPENKKEDTKPPMDLLDMADTEKPAAKKETAPKANVVDLLDSATPSAQKSAPMDLLDMAAPGPAPAASKQAGDLLGLDLISTPQTTPAPSPPSMKIPTIPAPPGNAGYSSGLPTVNKPDLLAGFGYASIAPAPPFTAFQGATSQDASQWNAFPEAKPMGMPFPSAPMSQPLGGMGAMAGASSFSKPADMFDPNIKQNLAGNGPSIQVTGTSRPPIQVTGTGASSNYDPFSGLASAAGIMSMG